MTAITIQTRNGPETISAAAIEGNWAVHHTNIAILPVSPDRDLWTVTYLPMGLRLPLWTTRESAMTLAIWLSVQVPEYDPLNASHRVEVIRNMNRIDATFEVIESGNYAAPRLTYLGRRQREP